MTHNVESVLARLRDEFIARLPARLAALDEHLLAVTRGESESVDNLHHAAHGLAGAAGVHRLMGVSEAARTVEQLVAALPPGSPVAAKRLAALRAAMTRLAKAVPKPGTSLVPSPPPRRPTSPRIMVVDDDADQALWLCSALETAGYQVEVFVELAAFRVACQNAEPPSAVIMGMVFPEGDEAGARTIAELKNNGLGQTPIICISVRQDIAARLAAYRAGASGYLTKPVNSEDLLRVMADTVVLAPMQPYRVLLVDDDRDQLAVLALTLRQAGMTVQETDNPLLVPDILERFDAEVLVLDMYMPQCSGPELAAVLRDDQKHAERPIVYLSAETDISKQLHALARGGDHFLTKPVAPHHLVMTVGLHARRYRQAHEQVDAVRATLYERDRHLQAVNAHALVSAADPAGNITYVNDKFCEVSGYSRKELLGGNHRILKSGEHPAAFYAGMWRTISRGEIWSGEICNRRKDGTHYWVESSIVPFVDASGRIYQYISIRTDITRVKQGQEALRASEERYRTMVEWTPEAVAVHRNGEVLYANPAALRAMGATSAQDLIGKPILELVHPAFHHLIEPRVKDILAKGFAPMVELQYIRLDGAVIDVEVYGTSIFYDGEPAIHTVARDVTESKRARKAVEELKERLRRGQQYANIGTWDWDIETGGLFWSERIAPLFGHAEGTLETTYDNFLNAIHPDDRQAVIDAVNACVERDVPYEIEHRVVWPDGTVRWLLERGAVTRDAAGRALHMLGVVQDINKRKQAELALTERERQLREAQTLAQIGNWTADIVTGELTWSDEIYRIFGHEPGSFAPSVEKFQAAVHPDDLAQVRESEIRAAQGGRHDVVHRIVRPDGTVRHVHELAQAETGATGKLLRLTGTVQDITERLEAQARLRETEERFAFAVDGAGDGVWDWDIPSNAMTFSRLYMEMLGYAELELPHHVDTWINSVHPDDMARIQQSLRDYLEGRLPAYAIELRLRCKNGDYKWILCRGTVVKRGDDGNPVRMIGIHSDITEQKVAEAALMEAREEADRANLAKSEFLSSMSHELRTPMNAIIGFSQLMESDAALSAENHDNVQEILKASRHLLELINEVLDLAKVESGHIGLSLEPVGVGALVEECLNLVEPLADQHTVQLSHGEFQGAAVRADRMRLKQALLNLLSNAIKYNREGGSVRIDVRPEGADRLRLLVTDTGPGIPAGRIAELFQPFHRLDAEASEIEGTGIGLTITRRIVEMMGGTVDVTSEAGVGSTFWIELPLESLPGQDRECAPADGATAAQRMEAARHTVLYIEDNPSNLKLVAQILGRRKHIHLLTAHTPELGIELALARRPELILLDINMPGMDGYQVLAVLKAEASLKAIPVIAVTANAMPRDIERGMAAGFNDYLTKPFDVRRFHAVIDHLLGADTAGMKELP